VTEGGVLFRAHLKEMIMLDSPRFTLSAIAATALVAGILFASNAAVAGTGAQVGQVSLLIGQAHVFRADGTKELLQRGSQVRVGDRIETTANGHVHMRFVDNAAVSVRPQSSLEVQAYRYNAEKPELSEVRLHVERGVSRSISGAATELDKTRFRLNTPLAAIGVRGTDFIVQTDATGVRATVSDGAIAVGVLGEGCVAAGLGPCAGAQLLSTEMGGLMAEIRPGETGARLVPAVDLSVAGTGQSKDAEGVGLPQQMAQLRAIGLAAAKPTGVELERDNDTAAAELLTLAAVRVPNLNQPSGAGNQLVWGRWGVMPENGEKLSEFFAVALLGRHVTVADEGAGLFRANQTVPGQLFSSDLQGTVEFRLNRASATFQQGDLTQPALISASNLTVDFTRRTFATGLDLTAASGIRGELRVAGGIRPDGIFTVRGNDQFVSGALSLDGKEAGYLFERQVDGGLFRGRTLWGP